MTIDNRMRHQENQEWAQLLQLGDFTTAVYPAAPPGTFGWDNTNKIMFVNEDGTANGWQVIAGALVAKGQMYLSSAGSPASSQALNVAFVQVAGFDSTNYNDHISPDVANDRIVIDYDGDYEVIFNASFTCTANRQYTFELRVNGASSAIFSNPGVSPQVLTIDVTLYGIVALQDGDILTIHASASSASTIQMYSSVFSAKYV